MKTLVVMKKLDRSSPPESDATPIRIPSGDIAFVCGKDVDGVHILRRRSEESPIETGLLRPLREGKPIDGEVVSLTQRRDVPLLFDVKSEFGGPAQPATADAPERLTGDGPAQVSSEAYRRGWDAVWGHRSDRTLN